AAAAFDEPAVLAALAEAVARPPLDPRLSVRWGTGQAVSVEVLAAEDGRPVNRLALTLGLDGEERPLEQTAPGRYAASLPAGPLPGVARLQLNGATLTQRAVAGRYPAEFEAIGNDADAAAAIATRTGGGVARLGERLTLPTRPTNVPLTLPLVVLGAALAAAGAVAIRRGL
ncbi:MAG: hypothetical protein ACFCVE_12215, partial [Phycisphaerae bacterium]